MNIDLLSLVNLKAALALASNGTSLTCSESSTSLVRDDSKDGGRGSWSSGTCCGRGRASSSIERLLLRMGFNWIISYVTSRML